jgi:hypothetical protein
VQVFRLGEEPPEWVEWADKTPQGRLRAAELLRRIAMDTPRMPPAEA